MNAGELFRRLKLFVRRDRMTRELEEEMRIHQELRAERVGPEAAHRRFGNTTSIQQQSRDAWGFRFLNDFADDAGFAARRVLKQRSVSIVIVAVMAVGIGATTAMFSAVDAALLRPLPFDRPEQLVMLPAQVGREKSKLYADQISFTEVAAMRDLFTQVAAYGVGGLNLASADHPIRLKVGTVTTEFFSVLGAQAARGRLFAPEEGKPGGANVAVLSDGLWKREFGSRSIAGLTITLNSRVFDVVGVMPPSFSFPEQSDVWIPMTVPLTSASFEPFRDYVAQTTIARLSGGVSTAAASTQLLARVQRTKVLRNAKDSTRNAQWVARVQEIGGLITPFRKVLARDRTTPLYVLLGATGLLLLIACANVTNLLLAQAAVRRREIAVRQVLGATRFRILRQLLTESILLSWCGALLGILVALGALQGLQAFMPPQLLGLSVVRIDWRVLSFSIALSVVSGIVFGLYPAFGSTRRDASESIKGGDGHGTTAERSGRLRQTLVAAEVALSVLLLVGAGIMLRSLEKMVTRDLGVSTTDVGTMELAFASKQKGPERFRILREVVERLDAMPEIQAAGISKTLPLATAGEMLVGIEVPGVTEERIRSSGIIMNEEFASSGFFQALQIRLVEGRLFNASEDVAPSKSAIINSTTAKLYWPDTSPLGRTFFMSGDTLIVIGVVADVVNHFDEGRVAQVFHPTGGTAFFTATIVARSNRSSNATVGQMMEAVRAVDPAQPVFNARMMEDVRDDSIAPRRASTRFLTIFAIIALSLSSVGVYAVVSYGLAQRYRELGIRSALGATGSNLMLLLSREMVWTASIGVAVGLAGAWAAARVLERLAYGVDVHDTMTFVLVPATLFAATLLATLVPARRVFRVNPSDVMRAD